MSNAKKIKIVEIIGYSLLALILVLVIIYVNVIHKEGVVDGYKIGEKCPDFEVLAYKTAGNPDSDTFSSADARGKVLVLNFWYINCGGCVKELPDFNEVQQEYSDDVQIVALHYHSMDNALDKQDYIDNIFNWSDYLVTFVQDTTELSLYEHFGGDGNFPMTVILDKEGIIRFTRVGSIDKTDLIEEVKRYI